MQIATILFCYNRTQYLEQLFDTIKEVDYAFIDYSGMQNEIAALLRVVK